ncbi:hypothetical protein ABBQ38_013645 [Trebouxia sp. C0009 RCD-2024]
MDAVFSAVGFLMNHINYAAIVTALAHIWEAARRNDRFRSHGGVCDRIEALYQRCVQSLQPLLADMHAQGFSTVLWSSAKLGLDPDAVVPGMTHHLILRLLKLIDVSEEKQRPNAQEAANVLWALATMGHQAAAEMVNAVCLHFARLTQHADAKQRPTAQAAAITLWALASMGHQAAAEVLDSVTTHFAHLVGSPNVKQRPDAQAVSNVVWALGTLKHTPRDVRLLDVFLAYFHVLLRSEDQRTRPVEFHYCLHEAFTIWKGAAASGFGMAEASTKCTADGGLVQLEIKAAGNRTRGSGCAATLPLQAG